MKFEDLEVGMLTTDGLITNLVPAGTGTMFGDKPAVGFFCLHDAYYGEAHRTFEDEDNVGNIVHDIGTLEYKVAIEKILKAREMYLEHALSDIKLLKTYTIALDYDDLKK